MPEGCGFSTVCAFSHVRKTSFLAIIPKFDTFFVKAEHFIIENCLSQDRVAKIADMNVEQVRYAACQPWWESYAVDDAN